MSFLTEEEAGSLAIRRMILHVVGADAEFEAQAEHNEIEHQSFFLDRIRGRAVAAVHSFHPGSQVKAQLQQIAADRNRFESIGQQLARDFSRGHVHSSKEGAFFLFELGVDDASAVMYAMLKYDYHTVLEQTDEDGKGKFRQIVRAFVTEKRAVQKSCIVRVRSGVAEDAVSAYDRMGRQPGLTDYFAAFLDVRRNRSDLDLTRNLNELLRATLQTCSDILPGKDVVRAMRLSVESLSGRPLVDESAMIEAVFHGAGKPGDEENQKRLERVVQKELRRHQLAGVEFAPDEKALAQRPAKRITTVERVTLSYPAEEEGRSVQLERGQNGVGWVITITTPREFVADDTLPAAPRPDPR